MPKIHEYFKNLPVGEIVNKRGIAYLKRLGFIWDYSCWGYVEGLTIKGKAQPGMPFRDELHLMVSPKQACKTAEQYDGAVHNGFRQTTSVKTNMTYEEMHEKFGDSNSFDFNGITFRLKYFDGCFNPYLVKDGPANGKTISHRFAFPGGVC